MQSPTGILDTPIGVVQFVMWNAERACIRTDEDNAPRIVVRQIPYHFRFQCVFKDGRWQEEDWSEPHLYRLDDRNKDASMAARKTVRNIMLVAWVKYLAEHPELSKLAAKAHLEDDINRAKGVIEGMREKLAEKESELTTLQMRLLELD